MVELKDLGSLGAFENIGTDKKIIEGEELVTLLNYVDIYHHKHIDASVPQMVVSASDKKIKDCSVEQGDIFVTPSSETVDDIGHSSVIEETIPNAVYSYHIMRFRLFDKNMLLSYYINYAFDTDIVKRQILKKAQGLTRFGLSKDKFASIQIPLPSPAEQQRIVEQLDTFTSSIENLKEQIAQRRKQYEYYRDQLLDLEGKEGVKIKKLGDVCDFIRGPFGGALKKEIFVKSGYAIYEQQHAIYGKWIFRYYIDTKKFEEMKRFEVHSGDILMSCSGTMGKTAIVPENHFPGIINQALLKLSVKLNIYNSFLKLFMDSRWFQEGLKNKTAGGAIQNVASVSILKELEIPLPSLEEQNRIVSILGTFEASISNLEAQLKEREKQYEYYRNKLLTFE